MTQFLLVRHGQSQNNALPDNQRVCDPDLTELGRQQADRTAKYLCRSVLRIFMAVHSCARWRPCVHWLSVCVSRQAFEVIS